MNQAKRIAESITRALEENPREREVLDTVRSGLISLRAEYLRDPRQFDDELVAFVQTLTPLQTALTDFAAALGGALAAEHVDDVPRFLADLDTAARKLHGWPAGQRAYREVQELLRRPEPARNSQDASRSAFIAGHDAAIRPGDRPAQRA